MAKSGTQGTKNRNKDMIRLFSHYVPRNTLLIALLEAFLLASSVYLAVYISAGDVHAEALAIRPETALLFAGVMLGAMLLMGLYGQASIEGWTGVFFRLVAAFALGLTMLYGLHLVVDFSDWVNGAAPISAAIALGAISAERLVFSRWRQAAVLKPRVLVLGTGSRAAQVDRLLRASTAGTMPRIVGFVPFKESDHHVPSRYVLELADGESVVDLVDRYKINELVVGVRDRRAGGMPVDDLLACKLRGVKVTELSSFFERESGQIRLESLNASWLIFGEGFRQNWLRTVMKRSFDIAASLALLVVTLPVMLLTALAILLTMGSPIFYRQVRVGQGGRHFSIYKFRSMRNDAEANGAVWARSNDDRITPVGHVIRKLRIDELPQIINVLKGEMSFVGPRPERPEFVADLEEQIPFYDARHSIKPGITGWAQVRYPYGASIRDAQEKLQYDLYYVKNHTLFLDLAIMMQTVEVVLWRKGSR